MRAVAIATDLMMVSRIAAAADAAGVDLLRVASPAELPEADDIRLVVVDWSERVPSWAAPLADLRERAGARVVLFGQHTDVEAHREARAARIGPMWARSKLIAELPRLFAALLETQ